MYGVSVSSCPPSSANVTGDGHMACALVAPQDYLLQKVVRYVRPLAGTPGRFSPTRERMLDTGQKGDVISWIYFYL